ncbi:caspase-3-like [Ornithodoros turicata]|uniref:caspase-3-like n=1 Tax=Ornithodoros turicata TaxID=34597 RepID=UPI00313A0370
MANCADEADGAWLNTIKKIFVGKGDDASVILPTSLQSEAYNMNHPQRGICAIFNHKVFKSKLNLEERTGTDVDVQNLKSCFSRLGFDVVIYDDYSVKQMRNTLESLSKKSHTEHDCFVCCVLTHGGEGFVYGEDGRLPVKDIMKPFLGSSCLDLVGKPKIFIIQACRGTTKDKGVTVVADTTDSDAVCKLPSHADILSCYSTVADHVSWRNMGLGSWFLQALCKVLNEQSHNTDLLTMLTTVNRYVAVCFKSCDSENKKLCGMKQVPCVQHTLTRLIFFEPKVTTTEQTFIVDTHSGC